MQKHYQFADRFKTYDCWIKSRGTEKHLKEMCLREAIKLFHDLVPLTNVFVSLGLCYLDNLNQ